MNYFIVDQNQELMRIPFFQYRKNMVSEADTIISLVEHEDSTEKDIVQAQKKLLELEGEFRTKYEKWNSPPVKLETMFLPKYSM